MTEMTNTTNAVIVSRACRIMHKAGKELKLLCDEIRAEMSRRKGYVFEEPGDSDRWDPSGWACSGTAITSTVKKRRDSGRGAIPVIGKFSILIDLYDQDGLSGEFGRALVHVAWTWKDDEAWDFLSITTTSIRENMHLVGDHLLVWNEEGKPSQPINWLGYAWMYLLPLDAIRSKEDISRLLFDPVFKLIEGGSMETAFDDAGEVLRFSVENARIRLEPDAAPEVA